jgi:hypothetical protein
MLALMRLAWGSHFKLGGDAVCCGLCVRACKEIVGVSAISVIQWHRQFLSRMLHPAIGCSMRYICPGAFH